MIDLNQNLNIKIGLFLSPKLELSLKILTMNIVELEEKFIELLESNPIIKLNDGIDEKKTIVFEDKFKELDENFKEKFLSEDYTDPMENLLPYRGSFKEKFFSDLIVNFDFSERDKQMAKEIVYNLDDKGFLDLDIEEFIKNNNIKKIEFEEIRKKIMSIEPIGCGSLNVYEFLNFQIDMMCDDEYKSILKNIVDSTKASNKRVNIDKTLNMLNIDESLRGYVKECVNGFLLYPLQFYGTNDDTYIEPDIIVKNVNDEFFAFLNDLFRSIDIDYNVLNSYLSNADVSKYAKEKYKEAMDFIVSINNRKKTLLKIMNLLIQKQRSFFENGYIAPITRVTIAKELGFNVSTIARAVSNKFFLFNGCVYPMSTLFSNRVGNTSKKNIESIILSLLENEDKSKPLSDDGIKIKLEKFDVYITRRAVTKYRKKLNIPNSRDRV